MAYFNLFASVSEVEVERLRRDSSFVLSPSMVLGASHLIGYWVQAQPLGGLLGQALDGGQPLHLEFWHPLRAPVYHQRTAVAELARDIGDAWRLLLASHTPEEVEWLSFEVGRLLRVFQHAAEAGEGIVSALDSPSYPSKVRLPWLPSCDAS